ncbi:ABC-type transport auxiliary lipoprotein family protein [Novosphingobium sp. M1R2S20]|uniref:ABC-type transport auxiliary lipoprotein family protein n=1 Tax=Novosphingobium rhizovicinum TaxID=3228928 RepID=A0ABV3R7V7_9SPHN
MMSKIRLGTMVAIATLSLSGCVNLGGKAPDQLISLSADTREQVGPVTSGSMADAIIVLDPEADRSLDMLRVPVRVDPATIAYLKDIGWVERPARQFRRLLAETLRARTNRIVVEEGDFDVLGRTTLSSRLLDMGYDARSQSVVVRIDMRREERAGAITSRRFEAVVPGVAPKPAPVAAAIGRAANDVADQVASWVIE